MSDDAQVPVESVPSVPAPKGKNKAIQYVQASRRRKGKARHQGESFTDMARRLSAAKDPAQE